MSILLLLRKKSNFLHLKANGNDSDTVDFENYRHVCHKWHYKIAKVLFTKDDHDNNKIVKALVVCLESKNFVPIRWDLVSATVILRIVQELSDRALKYSVLRNSLIVLTKIIQHFPAIQNLATVIEKRVEKVFNQIEFR